MSAENSTIFDRLRAYFTSNQFSFDKKILFCPGTAPMNEGHSEVYTIIYSTDFDIAYFVDPGYTDPNTLQDDLAEITELAENSVKLDGESDLQFNGRVEVTFQYQAKERRIIFIAGDATKQIPDDFNVYFSGCRVCINNEREEYGLESTPSQHLDEIVEKLPMNGLFFPDRDLEDDSTYFETSPEEVGLEEVEGIRQERTITEANHEEYSRLFTKYYDEAVRSGSIRSEIPDRTYFTYFNTETLGTEEYNSTDTFFEAHPEIDRAKCMENEFGLIFPTKKGASNFLNKMSKKLYTSAEQTLLDRISERCQIESQVERTVRGVSLYKKVA